MMERPKHGPKPRLSPKRGSFIESKTGLLPKAQSGAVRSEGSSGACQGGGFDVVFKWRSAQTEGHPRQELVAAQV